MIVDFAGDDSTANADIPHPSRNSQNTETSVQRITRLMIKKGFLTMNQRTPISLFASQRAHCLMSTIPAP